MLPRRNNIFHGARAPTLSPSPKASAAGESFGDSVRTERSELAACPDASGNTAEKKSYMSNSHLQSVRY